MSEPPKPRVKVKLLNGYQFRVTFPGVEGEGFTMDEPAPLGALDGPNASRVLTASIANCLSASLLFCLSRSKVEVLDIETDAEPTVERNEEGYWRVKKVDVSIRAKLREPADKSRVNRCLEIFENYCVVTGAVREGIGVGVSVNLV
ncbi:MAG: OsmC family protein [Nitrososphaerota archaeon]|nr:OsmC family protein [Nitrososphaerota archaeon]